ncbi:hypothetical protein BGZ47_002105, partial [Haplosporangium gracile]
PKAVNPPYPHHFQKTFFIEGEDDEKEREQRQDIDMTETTTTMMQGNNTRRSTRSINNNDDDDDNLGPLDSQQQQQPDESSSDNNNNNINNNSDCITITSPAPSQRLTPQQTLDLQLQLQQQPNMQQPAPPITATSAAAPATAEKLKKRRTSLSPTAVTSSLVQNSHTTQHRRSSSASWAYGENGAPWSPWSRWRVVLKLLYAVVVPAVIIYLLKNMDEQVAARRKHQQDNRHFRHSGSKEGGDKVSLLGHHCMTSVPSSAPVEQQAKGSVWWNERGVNPDEYHRCTGGEVVDEPRKKNSHWFSDGDH